MVCLNLVGPCIAEKRQTVQKRDPKIREGLDLRVREHVKRVLPGENPRKEKRGAGGSGGGAYVGVTMNEQSPSGQTSDRRILTKQHLPDSLAERRRVLLQGFVGLKNCADLRTRQTGRKKLTGEKKVGKNTIKGEKTTKPFSRKPGTCERNRNPFGEKKKKNILEKKAAVGPLDQPPKRAKEKKRKILWRGKKSSGRSGAKKDQRFSRRWMRRVPREEKEDCAAGEARPFTYPKKKQRKKITAPFREKSILNQKVGFRKSFGQRLVRGPEENAVQITGKPVRGKVR